MRSASDVNVRAAGGSISCKKHLKSLITRTDGVHKTMGKNHAALL